MEKGTARVVALEDNDEDFEVLQLACGTCRRRTQLQRFTRAELLMEQVASKTLERPSLFLLDLRMPGEGGRLALKTLKQCGFYQQVPVVILSTSTNPIDISECYAVGANAYHEKLIETPRMIELLTSVLDYWLDQVTFRLPARVDR